MTVGKCCLYLGEKLFETVLKIALSTTSMAEEIRTSGRTPALLN